MLNKEYFFQGKSVLRKIKDKAFYDFLVAHQGAGAAIKYIPTGFYHAPNGETSINVVKVIGGSIDMEYHLCTGGGYISETDWYLLFREDGKTDREELIRRFEEYDKIVYKVRSRLPWYEQEEFDHTRKSFINFMKTGMRK
ncbi:hypothetical protein KNT87_gp185 [Erwinia phage Cronus]|uniref:Uncharacterized protein n=1 Tax=Erwinia phage Cronus TaxID=2163633 RepID=A0A2S1GLY4_9CAUD|nr:hypothetical protein KNT87_gp185 [Erwinia phage Cronus]AWD90384.1 hypothetical protein [Erwinia phage Cronus]